MDTVLKADLKSAVNDLLENIDFMLDWDELPARVPLSLALAIVDQSCTVLTAAPREDLENEPVRLPPHRFPRDYWRASNRTRAIIKLFFPESSRNFTWWQGEFRYYHKNAPCAEPVYSCDWDATFVQWVVAKLRSSTFRETPTTRSSPPEPDPLPDVEFVDLSPTIDALAYKLSAKRIFAGKLRKDWYIKESVLRAAEEKGVPREFSINFKLPFISEYNRQKHRTTALADHEFVKYIEDRHRRILVLLGADQQETGSAVNSSAIPADVPGAPGCEGPLEDTEYRQTPQQDDRK